MKHSRVFVLAMLAAMAILAGCAPSAAQLGAKPRVIMGSANFGEQVVLGELYAQALEAKGYQVERKLNLGSREIVAPALERGEINVYPEYMATYLTYLSKDANRASADPATTHKALEAAVKEKNLVLLDHAAAQDQNVFVVTKATADKYGLKKVSDLAKVNGQLSLGGPPTCPERPFCLIGLKDVYGLTFKEFKPLDTGGPITVQSLEGNQVDVALLFTTNPQIALKGFVPLQDDKGLQRADNVAPVVRADLLNQAGPEFRTIMNSVSSRLSTDDLMSLNKGLDVDRKDARVVASDWLKQKGIIQ